MPPPNETSRPLETRFGSGNTMLRAIGVLLLLGGAARGQTTGAIAGWIVDASGSPLGGVTLEASGSNLQGKRTVTTEKDGTYRLPALPPGRYTVRATLPGFASVERTTTVTVDATAFVRMILQLSIRETSFVTAETPYVDTTTTTGGANYNTRVIIHLPVDRNYADVLFGHPGVVQDLGDSQGRSVGIAIRGSTSAEQQWVVDGVNTTNIMKGVQGKAVDNEWVEEVEVKTGGYQAEYGRALGGVINVVTKSGGNAFHGGAFVYYDSGALEASRVYIDGVDSPLSGMRVADYSRTDYGVDLGGYVIRDRIWFFGAYNRTELPAQLSRFQSSELVPSTMEFPLDGVDTLYSVKVTGNFSPGTTVVGSVFGDPTTNSGAGASDPRQRIFRFPDITNPDPATWEATRTIGAADYGLRVSQLFGPAVQATLQAARHQDRFRLTPTPRGDQVQYLDFECNGGTSLDPCQIPPSPNFVEGGFGELGGPANNSDSWRNQIRANADVSRGAHDFRFGADYQDAKTKALGLYSGGQQVFRFNDVGVTYYLHRFFAATPQDLGPVPGVYVGSAREYGVYAQDSWRAAPGWTVNVGLRWDTEQYIDHDGVKRIQISDEWQPRVGIVWDPSQNGSAKVYVYAGRFYHPLTTELIARGWGVFPSSSYNFDPVSVVPNPGVTWRGQDIVGGPYHGVGPPFDPNLKGISLDEFTIGAEKMLGRSLVLGIQGTYRRLHNAIEDRCDVDWSTRENIGCAFMNPGSSEPISKGEFPYCTGLNQFDNCDQPNHPLSFGAPAAPPARRLYRGIELFARETISDRLWLQGSYVFSSLRGNYDGLVSEQYEGRTNPGFNPDYDWPQMFHDAYGRLYLDRPHDLRLSGFYTTPFRLSVGVEGYFLSGPPLSQLGYLNENYPIGMVNLVPRGYAGRMPNQWDASVTAQYPWQIGPATVTLQAYVFNVFNNQIATNQDQTWSNQPPQTYPDSIYDPKQPQSNPYYGLVTSRQPGRLFRGAVRVSF